MIIIENFAGTHKEIGLAKGKMFRHLINNFIQEGFVEHAPHALDAVKGAYIENNVKVIEKYCPEYLTEIRAMAEGSGLPFEELILLSIYWQALRTTQAPSEHCFTVGVLDADGMPVFGANWDSPRIIVLWNRVAPEGRYRHLSMTLPGTPFSERGMNEKGLVIMGSSLTMIFDKDTSCLQHSIAQRMALERCETVTEAFELLRELPVVCSYMAADAKGNLAGLQKTQAGFSIHEPSDGTLALGNNIVDEDLLEKTKAIGSVESEEKNEHNMKRMAAAEEMFKSATGDFDVDFVKKFLASHQNYPHSICNDGNASSTIAEPARDKETLLISERFPCRNQFEKHNVSVS